jgi:shikimate kinase
MKALGPEGRVVFLVGFMGAGKTTVGRALGELLGWRFEDLDDVICSREGSTIEAIFQEFGEAGFRRMEHAALRATVSGTGVEACIVGLGGGAFVQAENAALLQQTGAPVVFLDAPVEELWRRCQGEATRRPLQKSEREFRDLYERRRPQYLAANIQIDTSGKTIEKVALEVAAGLGLRANVDVKEP